MNVLALATMPSKNLRLDIKLFPSTDSFYNSVNYLELLGTTLGNDAQNLELIPEDSADFFKDYEEESYIDNTEVFTDSYPAGKEPKLGGFFVNQGRLKLKSVHFKKIADDKQKVKKNVSNEKFLKKENKIKKSTIMKRKFEKSKLPKKPRKADMNTKLDSILMTLLKQKNMEIKTINIGNSSKSSSSVKSSVTPKKVDFTKKYLKPHSKSNSTSTPPRKTISCEVNRPTKRRQVPFNDCMETSNSHTAISKGKSHLSKKISNQTSSKINATPVLPTTIPIKDFIYTKQGNQFYPPVIKSSSPNYSTSTITREMSKSMPQPAIDYTLSNSISTSNYLKRSIPNEDFLSVKTNSDKLLNTKISLQDSFMNPCPEEILCTSRNVHHDHISYARAAMVHPSHTTALNDLYFSNNEPPKRNSPLISPTFGDPREEIRSMKYGWASPAFNNNSIPYNAMAVTPSYSGNKNSPHKSYNTNTAVNLFKMNISPIVTLPKNNDENYGSAKTDQKSQ